MTRFVRLTCLALLLALLAVPCCHAAPAPLPRRPARCTTWRLDWHGAAYRVRLHADGAYEATDGRTTWRGTWHAEGGVLRVRESVEGPPTFSWSCDLGAARGPVTMRRAGR